MAKMGRTLLRWPFLDTLLPVIGAAIWVALGTPSPDRSATDLMLTALASAGGLVMAVATFAASIMYQSTDDRVVSMRTKFMDQLRRNWTWIFCSLLTATLLPILGIALGSSFPALSLAAAIVAALLVTTNLLRVVYLLRLILFLESVHVQEHVRGSAPADNY